MKNHSIPRASSIRFKTQITPPPLDIRLKKEQEEKEQKRKEKAEAHLYTIIKVARNEDLLEQIGKDIYFDLVDHEKVHSFRIQKQMPFNFFKEEVAKEFGIPVQFQRFWFWTKRQNRTYRPNRPLTPQEEARSVGQLREVSNKANNAELKLFLEVEVGLDLKPVRPPEKTTYDILLFFKLYDPLKEELRYVGRLFVKVSGEPVEILTKLNEMVGFSPDEEIELYEEIKFEPIIMCERIDKKVTFRTSQLEDGDIICFQKSAGSSDQCRYPDVPSFLKYVHNRQVWSAPQSAAAAIPSSSTPASDTPSSSTPAPAAVTLTSIAAQLSYLVDKVNVLLERTETIESDVLQMRTDATRNRADMKRLQTDVAWIKKYLEEPADDIDALPSTAPPSTADVEESGSC